MQTLVIVNPKAGRGKSLAIWQKLSDRFTAQSPLVTSQFTAYPGHARELAAQAWAGGYRSIVSLGGDGTIHEIINGLAGSDLTLGIIPAGTGNDFARTLAIPADPVRAYDLLQTGRTRPVDLGLVNGEYFMNVAGVGFDAEVVNDVNTSPRLIKGGGAYLLSVLKMLGRYRPTLVKLEADGIEVNTRVYIVAVANGQYYGGGMKVAPAAVPDDGRFEICLVKDLSKPAFLRAFPSVFQGKHGNHPAVSFYQAARVRVSSDSPLVVHADGEIIGTVPADFSLLPGALKVIVPE